MIKIGNSSFKLPDKLQDQVDEIVEELGYQNRSEYYRTAVREKVEKDLPKAREDGGTISLEEGKDRVSSNE